MQFITTDNRIAVENFQIGYFYTITFNNHNYIITTCTGKGDNFVSFLCSEPELVFDLTMQTADTIATIELYGGGTGTTDYNNLANKPTINNVILVGNKTTSDLLINDVPVVTSADDNKVLISSYSGGVGSYSWETYSPISSYDDLTDKPTINSVTLTGNKTSSDLGLQPEINSENPLLSDNISDTDQTNKFATAAQLAQIATNQNNISINQANISLIEQMNGAKNYIYYAGETETITTGGANITVTNNGDGTLTINGTAGTNDIYISITKNAVIPLSLATGAYVLSGVDSTSTNVGIVITPYGVGTQIAALYPPQAFALVTISTSGNYTCVAKVYANTTVDNATLKPMLINKTIWDGGFTDFQKYALTNGDITAWIIAHS